MAKTYTDKGNNGERDPFVDSLNHFLVSLEEDAITGIQYQEVQDSFTALIIYRAKTK